MRQPVKKRASSRIAVRLGTFSSLRGARARFAAWPRCPSPPGSPGASHQSQNQGCCRVSL
eukprot:1833255-Rhodomonas_salina.1